MHERIAYSISAALILLLVACGGQQNTGEVAKLDNQGGGQSGDDDKAAAVQADSDPIAPPAPGLPDIPDSPQPAPRTLLATAVMDAPSAQMVTMGGFLDRIQPGMSAALNDEFLDQMVGNLVGLDSVSGLDYSKPLRAVVLDPKQVGMPVVMVAAVADAKTLARSMSASNQVSVQMHQGWAAMGTPEALALAAPHALTTLVAESAPPVPTLTVRSRQILDIYGNELNMFASMIESQAASDPSMASGKLMMDKLMGLLADSDRMELSLDLGADATGKLVVVPRAGTGTAALLAQQSPAEFTLASAVPAGSFFAAGHMSESLMQALDAFNRSSMAQMYGAANAEKLAEAMHSWYQAMSGEFAMSGSVSPQAMNMSGMWSVTDAKKAQAAMKKVLDAMPKKATTAEGAELIIKRQPRALRHKGVTAEGVRITGDFKNLPEDQRKAMETMFGKQGFLVVMAVVGDHTAFAMGSSRDATAQMRTFIDTAKGKKQTVALGPAAVAVLDNARARKESMVFAFDMASRLASFGGAAQAPATGDWISFAVGFPQNTIEIRLSVPASTARLLLQMSMGAGAGAP